MYGRQAFHFCYYFYSKIWEVLRMKIRLDNYAIITILGKVLVGFLFYLESELDFLFLFKKICNINKR